MKINNQLWNALYDFEQELRGLINFFNSRRERNALLTTRASRMQILSHAEKMHKHLEVLTHENGPSDLLRRMTMQIAVFYYANAFGPAEYSAACNDLMRDSIRFQKERMAKEDADFNNMPLVAGTDLEPRGMIAS